MDQFRPSADWCQRAATAHAVIEGIAARLPGATPEETKAILREIRDEIGRHSGLWRELKPRLEQLSREKCWYCETKQERSNMAVDHFRPKGGVTGCSTHPGYWWLALAANNYRFSCTYCNSLLKDEDAAQTYGKGNHFPLVDEARRDYGPNESNGESPHLLDPIEPDDPPLLGFLENGEATPSYKKERSKLFFERAEVSIRVYNLNHAGIVDARSLIAFKIKHQVKLGEKYLDQAMAGDMSARDLFREVNRVLSRCIAQDAKYSVAARAFLSTYRDKDWVEAVLRTA